MSPVAKYIGIQKRIMLLSIDVIQYSRWTASLLQLVLQKSLKCVSTAIHAHQPYKSS
jgi:hypothetical protein